MKCLKKIVAILVLVTSTPALGWGESYKCPEDNCILVDTCHDKFCSGVNCRHIKIYRCGCCGKCYEVYVD